MFEFLLSIAFYVSTAVTVLILLLPSQYDPNSKPTGQDSSKSKATVQILVLGDIGRSPRMQYHAMSIAKRGGLVDIIGYHGALSALDTRLYLANCLPESEPHPDVSSDSRISVVPLPPHPSVLQTSNKLLFLFFAPLKVIFQVVCLWRCLAYRTEPAKWLIVQVSRVDLFS